ncbi:MAG: hypothetical protein ACRC62_29710 [Microcoleus sp.]
MNDLKLSDAIGRYQRYRYARLRQRAGKSCEFEVAPYKLSTLNSQLSTN